MPYNFDLLLPYNNLSQLRTALAAMERTVQEDLRSLRYHTSLDTRVRAIYTLLFLQKSQSEVAEVFWVHQTTISKWMKKLFTEDLVSVPDTGLLSDADGEFLENGIASRPLLFLREIKSIVNKHLNKNLSVPTIHRFLVVKRKWTRKKAQIVVRKAKAILIHSFSTMFRRNFGIVFQTQLVFVDELSFRLEHVSRNFGRSPKGTRVHALRPNNFKQRQISFIVAISVDGYLFCHSKQGHFTRRDFVSFLTDMLKSKLLGRHGMDRSIVIMDGCRIHRHQFITRGLNSAGVSCLVLPPYCPEMNPIEAFFKEWRHRVRESTEADINSPVFTAIKKALQLKLPKDCSRLFDHAGWLDGEVYQSPYFTKESLRRQIE
ncbi:hypothetical protein RCL1_001694 [Eukaryota sp. TZLM3-RCL]